MVDCDAREQLIRLLCRYQNAEITGNELIASNLKNDDVAIGGIYREYNGYLYGGGHLARYNPKLFHSKINDLPNSAWLTKLLDRTILFLQTDLEYKWRSDSIFKVLLFSHSNSLHY